ncbi:MAG: hypothetical protein PHW24_03555 [Candidatus Moranbacteria bacterium]|nr:hypothetical protein [Candidatus Moranbacteria bacterium]
MEAIKPTALLLHGNEPQSAAILMDAINKGIRESFDRKNFRAKVRLPYYNVDGPVKLHIIKELEAAGWKSVYFSTEGHSEYINMVANFTPSEIVEYL